MAERLVSSNGLCQMASTEFCRGQTDCYTCPHGKKVFKSEAAYEDTGLEPSEVVDTVKLLQDVATKYETSVKINSINTGLLNKAQEELEAYRALGTVEELAALVKRNTPTETIPSTVNRGIGVTGEYDIDYNLLCPECGCVVGDYETEEQDDFCRVCGQKLKLPKEADYENN